MKSLFTSLAGGINRLWHDQRGFTLVEMISVLAIMGVLSAMVITNTQVGNKRQQVREAASAYVTAVRYAESLAATSQAVNGQSRKAYGVCIVEKTASTCAKPGTGQANAYLVYARKNTDLTTPLGYPNNPDVVRRGTLPTGVIFEDLGSKAFTDFFPPSPTMQTCNDTCGASSLPNFTVYLRRVEDAGTCSTTVGLYCQGVRFQPPSGAVYVQ